MSVSLSVFKKLFWDVDFSTIDPVKNKRFVIERVLEYGGLYHFEKLKELYSLDDIKEVLKIQGVDATTIELDEPQHTGKSFLHQRVAIF